MVTDTVVALSIILFSVVVMFGSVRLDMWMGRRAQEKLDQELAELRKRDSNG